MEKLVKKKIIKYLDSLPFTTYHIAVQDFMSKRGVSDIIACCNGIYVAIELKATPKNNATALQADFLESVEKANGLPLIVDEETKDELMDCINFICFSNSITDSNNYIGYIESHYPRLLRWRKSLSVEIEL